MSVYFILGFTFLFSITGFAGDNGGGSISCKSGTGRTRVEGRAGVAYNGFGRAEIDFTVDGKVLKLGQGSEIGPASFSSVDAVTFEPKLKVFTMKFAEAMQYSDGVKTAFDTFELVADPQSWKVVRPDVFRFKAIISGLDPREDHKTEAAVIPLNNRIEVLCTLDVSL